MTKLGFIFFILLFFIFSACSVQFNQTNNNSAATKPENNNSAKNDSPNTNLAPIEDRTPIKEQSETADNSSCYGLKRKDLFLDKHDSDWL